MPTTLPANRLLTTTDWNGYLKFLAAAEESHIKVTYDRGRLELVTPSTRHEWMKSLAADLVKCYMLETGIDFVAGGSSTLRRQASERGLEPDECFWIDSAGQVQDLRRDYDPELHPPPDLVIEVEVSKSVLDRIAIYAALGVPAVWRITEQAEVIILTLQDGKYFERLESSNLPGISQGEFSRHLKLGGSLSTSQVIRSFRDQLTLE